MRVDCNYESRLVIVSVDYDYERDCNYESRLVIVSVDCNYESIL